MSVGFTGFAYIDYRETIPVSLWIADTLRFQTGNAGAIDALVLGASKVVHNLSLWPKRKLSIVIAGVPPGADFGYVARISNFEDGDEKYPIQLDHFIVNEGIVQVSDPNFHYFPSGVALKPDELDRMEQELPHAIAVGGMNNVARYLVGLQRRVASRTNAVGLDAMVVSIPVRPMAPGLQMFLSNIDNDAVADDLPSFSYVRAHSWSPQRFAPLISSGDGSVVRLTHTRQGVNSATTSQYLRFPGWLDAGR